jgi:hypothetical protein
MLKRNILILMALVVAVALSQLAWHSPVTAGGRPLSAILAGANEVGGGDPDGSGLGHITLNQGQEEVCYEITVAGIDTPTRAHIHSGVAGVNGPIVVAFFDFVSPPPLQGCVSGDSIRADDKKALIKAIRQNPENYYLNVHNATNPGGAVRGQLEK